MPNHRNFSETLDRHSSGNTALSDSANPVGFYDEELRRTRDKRNFVITRLRSALTRNQLSLAYQFSITQHHKRLPERKH